MAPVDRLGQQLAFLREVEKLKSVYRSTPLADGSRKENSGEHSWTLALYALVLADQAGPDVDVAKAVRMLLIHDLVEIDVGDVPLHSQNGLAHGAADIVLAEAAAAKRIFGLLPPDLAQEMLETWHEFEDAQTPTARYAKSLDRVQPPVLNMLGDGGSWLEYDVTLEQIDTRIAPKVALTLPNVWQRVRAEIAQWFSAHGRI
ncbi:metal dependent phosphohydrolase [Ketogulonicigenium robustum]|uniref:Metal dependent phosphohydrolase n=1 Tax=Ketogulonicigenium robustum TaxID=92947 RepID=A0A1W6NYR3_9RHOB|nr:HD domain-containing protein [Ketogulonicigenium robustum]ARO14388.1 metal dependent phosphohydrolase [Ketogulonicigenium robustum]